MRNAIILGSLLVVGSVFATDATASCQCVCRMTPYGKVCREICSAPPRQHVPDRSYNYSPPVYQQAGPSIPPELVAIGLVAVVITIIAAIVSASSGTGQIVAETEQVRTNTAYLYGLTDEARGRTADLEAEMQRRARESFEQGRRDADEAWHRHG